MKKQLHWELRQWPFADCFGKVWTAKVGKGRLWLHPSTASGTSYTSSFGPNSEKSFTGFLPGMDQEQAKQNILADASRHW